MVGPSYEELESYTDIQLMLRLMCVPDALCVIHNLPVVGDGLRRTLAVALERWVPGIVEDAFAVRAE